MDMWEYKTIWINQDYLTSPAMASKVLNPLGKEGWELVSVAVNDAGRGCMYLKRKINNG